MWVSQFTNLAETQNMQQLLPRQLLSGALSVLCVLLSLQVVDAAPSRFMPVIVFMLLWFVNAYPYRQWKVNRAL